jgi:hypothetical protein
MNGVARRIVEKLMAVDAKDCDEVNIEFILDTTQQVKNSYIRRY